MSPQIEALQRTIDYEKASINRGLDAMEDKARAMVDWREPIRNRPWDAVGLALLGGGIIALMGGKKRRKQKPRATRAVDNEPDAPASSRSNGIRTRVVAALTTFAVAKAGDVLQHLLPGRESAPARPEQ
ncbi:MAG TPA: hypothetical protein VMK53_03970 [Gemmatimonadales bacterium]|nr:hypothetical protein [Gemmatimonadales bacterium]